MKSRKTINHCFPASQSVTKFHFRGDYFRNFHRGTLYSGIFRDVIYTLLRNRLNERFDHLVIFKASVLLDFEDTGQKSTRTYLLPTDFTQLLVHCRRNNISEKLNVTLKSYSFANVRVNTSKIQCKTTCILDASLIKNSITLYDFFFIDLNSVTPYRHHRRIRSRNSRIEEISSRLHQKSRISTYLRINLCKFFS